MSKVMSISNVLESFVPIVRERNYAPTRTFVTKWDVEIDRNRVKKINRGRDRTAKYFDDFDHHSDSLPPLCYFKNNSYENDSNCDWELESDVSDCGWDLETDDAHNTSLRSVHAENAYYERIYPDIIHELGNQLEITRKRFVHFEEDEDQSLFKRGRNL